MHALQDGRNEREGHKIQAHMLAVTGATYKDVHGFFIPSVAGQTQQFQRQSALEYLPKLFLTPEALINNHVIV